jgi:hypothetical protein
MKDYNALQVFLILMQTHSTKRTAQRLGRSQSYVSKVLAQLRESLDDQLFIRSADGLMPTTYAMNIEPKLQEAFDQIGVALSPEVFDPKQVDKVTLHIVDIYLTHIGKKLIQAIRAQTDAIIEIRTWTNVTESLIEQGDVDMGLHILGDKPQSIYQKRLHSGVGVFDGNRSGEYVKYIVNAVNDYRNHYKTIDPSIEATLIIDNHHLMTQLLDSCFTLRYQPTIDDVDGVKLSLDVALIMKSTKRQSPKNLWLMSIIEPLVLDYIKDWNEKDGFS